MHEDNRDEDIGTDVSVATRRVAPAWLRILRVLTVVALTLLIIYLFSVGVGNISNLSGDHGSIEDPGSI